MRFARNDLADLGRYLSADAKHTTDKKRPEKLEGVVRKIQKILDMHNTEEPSRAGENQDARSAEVLTEQSVKLAERAAQILTGAEQLGIKSMPVARLPIPEADRLILSELSGLPDPLRRKLQDSQQCLTIGDVGDTLLAIAEAMLGAQPLEGVALIMMAKSLIDGLHDEVIAAAEAAQTPEASD